MEISANSSSFWRKNLFVYKIISTFAPFFRRSPLTLMNNTIKHMKHFRLVLATLLVALFSMAPSSAWAQMSDDDVAKMVTNETGSGTSKAQIVTKLVQKGVNIDQIRRVRKQMDTSTTGTAGTGGTRLRTNNGETAVGTGMSTPESAAVDDDSMLPGDEELALLIEELTPDGRRVFGRNIFNKKLLSFEPNMNIATPQNYVLGPGDQLFLEIYGASQKTEQLEVSPEGTVTVPGYGPVHVAGLTVAGAQSRIHSTVGSRYASSRLSLSVGQTRTISVNVMGEVRAPGTYTLSAFSTVFHALYMAGGIGSLGTLRNIKVFRQGRQITVVDVYDYILNGRLAGNIRLADNDVIVVSPYDCLVGIEGLVKRPMTYEMRSTESVASLLKYAGGFAAGAYKERVRVNRIDGVRKSVHTVNEFDFSSFRLADGDSVTIDSALNRYQNLVEVKGAVFYPGRFELGSEINSVKTLIEQAGGLTEDAFTSRAVLTRRKPDRTFETHAVDLNGLMAGTIPDIPLRNEDVLTVGSEEEIIQNRWVYIEGEVQHPDSFQYAENTTIEDLIVLAGGLTDAASVSKVDVSRRIRDAKATKSGKDISRVYTFSLKDGLVVDGEPGFFLEPYDVVYVRKSPGYMQPRNIRVEGEVEFEGTYTMSTKNQRLSDAVKAAGGVTSEAYVRGARLMRHVTDDERMRIQSTLRMAQKNRDDYDSVNVSEINLPDDYPVGIELDKALANPGGDYDIVLRDSDRLIIPEYNGTVKISGSVLFPNTVAYNVGKRGYKWYINQSGGYGHRARKRKTYIVYQNGMMTKASKGKVEPGCEIIVPTKTRSNTDQITANLQKWVTIGTGLTSLSAIIMSMTNLFK